MTHNVKKGRFILLFLLFILTGCSLSPGGMEIEQNVDESASEGSVISGNNTSDEDNLLWVHVCGEVNHPGVYSFPEGSRVFDAVEAAGGFTEHADQESVNLAMSLIDEGKIYVPGKEEGNEDSGSAQGSSDGRINLNTATLEELMTLPGIGEKRAESILKLREEKGSFQTVEELLEAEGIKEGIFQQIKDFVKV